MEAITYSDGTESKGNKVLSHGELLNWRELHRRQEIASNPPVPKRPWAGFSAGIPAPVTKQLAQIHKAWRELQKQLEPFGHDQTNAVLRRQNQEFLGNPEYVLAPESKVTVKNELKRMRRQLKEDFKARNSESYFSLMVEGLTLLIPALEKAISLKVRAYAKQCEEMSLPDVGPDNIILGLVRLRGWFIDHLKACKFSLERIRTFNEIPAFVLDEYTLGWLNVEITPEQTPAK